MKKRDDNEQVDIAILDFSKAFDTVPHKRLLGKLEHYGIRGPILSWFNAFLTTRQQRVVVDGAKSLWSPVLSGVPQGTVAGPIMFLLHINDLPACVSSQVRLFADDCLLYRPITCTEDQLRLQRDLDILCDWASRWGMKFNPSKCAIMRIARSNTPLTRIYSMTGIPISQVEEAKYLGLTLSDDLSWSTHVQNTYCRANRTLGFLRRNLRRCPEQLKETAYFALVRSVMEYSCTIWDPYLKGDIEQLDKVQRRAARFVKGKYYNHTAQFVKGKIRYNNISVSTLLQELRWMPLKDRRKTLRLTLMYKVVNNLIAVPTSDILTPTDTRTRSAHQHCYKHLTSSTNQYKHSFFPRTIPEWNKLPKETAEAPSLAEFKSKLS